jgi:small-conductance mechanosensitive channel
MSQESHKAGWFELLLCLSYIFTLFLFWAGDRALILLSECNDIRRMCRKMIIPDLLATSIQAIIFITMAGYLLHSHEAYTRLLLTLAAFNMVWLSLKQFQFNAILESDEVADPVFKARLRQARNAMLKWNAINGVFLLVSIPFLENHFPVETRQYVLVALALARSIADLVFCADFYTDCIEGAFTKSL